jgi:hypothetical protein
MSLILSALFTVGLVAVLIWAAALVRTADSERRAARALADEERKRLATDVELHKPDAPLRCLNCGAAFIGPLTEDGCPKCHLGSLVVTELEYQMQQRETD